ncbi:MAG: gliding motility-related protein [Bacteroidetes bacterium]|jgi:hypothetical protein|nr:gliding motility-related protein [Bacteroidota bacterium]
MAKHLRTPCFLVFFILFFLAAKTINASHVSGGEVTYSHISGNQYKVQLVLYWDCASFDPGTTAAMVANNSCGLASVNIIANLDTAYEVSQICPTSINSTTCNGGSLPGFKKNVYSALVSLPGACNNWSFEHTSCCRNITVNVPSQPSYTFYAKLNNQDAPTNNSPVFTSQPLPYVCVNQSILYNFGVSARPDDSLSYSFVNAMDINSITPVPYASGYSGTTPIPGITINPSSGLISFTSSTMGAFVVAVLVRQYNTNGILVGSIVRDIQFNVFNCSNVIPTANAGSITNFSGSATLTGNNSIIVCPGNNFSFDITFNDTNSGDSLDYQTNLSTLFPGAVLTSNGYNPMTLNVSWTAPLSVVSGMRSFTVTISDGFCPVPGLQNFVYNILINQRTNAGPDVTYCNSQPVQLNASEGTSFSWSVLSGPPMIVGTNFSCVNCVSPIASPTATTVYELVSNLTGSCINRDTVVVNVVSGFTFNAAAQNASSCISQPNQLSIVNLVPVGSGYSYEWLPNLYLNNNLAQNPIATIGVSGSFTYTVSVVNAGCVVKDSVQINIPYPMPPPVIYADTSVCAGSTIQLTASAGTGVPSVCGITAAGCGSSFSSVVGTASGSNTNTTWPAPYGNWYTSTKHQMLFTAAELNAAGITGGKISQIDFEITAINGTSVYHNYKISMGCTNLINLGTTWSGGLFQVFDPATVPIAVGWNTHIFNNAFEWDGVSNIIVEICSNEGPGAFGFSNYTNNSISPYTTTAFTSCLYSYTDQYDMCPNQTNIITQSNNRPVIKFHYCAGVTDTSNFSYSWMPSGSITNPNSQVTSAVVNVPTTYTLTVTDTTTGCSSTATQQVNLSTDNMSVIGNVIYAGSPINGYAKLFEYASGVQMPLIDSVTITNGAYAFSNVSDGNYIVQATADSTVNPLAFPVYYQSEISWDSADVITVSPACNDTVVADITIFGHAPLSGNNNIYGTIIEGNGYLHAAGMPLSGINVFLINTGGVPVTYTKSNNTGHYDFRNVPAGCYKIYVDIAGLPMDSTYTFCVTSNDTVPDLNFIADANSIFITNSSVSLDEITNGTAIINVYPNPTQGYTIIEYNLHEEGIVSLELINSLGQQIQMLTNENQLKGNHKVDFNASSYGCSPGIYLIKLQFNEKVITRRLILTK